MSSSSARRSRPLWLTLAVLGLAFWAYVVPLRGEWASVHAWGGFLLFWYVLYWQYWLAADEEE